MSRTDSRTVADDYGETYYRSHLGTEEPYDWESPHWRGFFTTVADRIGAITSAETVLDVGCARGLLVQALRARGIDAQGIDVSTHAIETAHPDVRPYVAVASAEKLTGVWDLITCVEVLEHIAATEAEFAIDAMCAATDRVLFSSSPSDFAEPTHVNVREPAAWAASFAERGFFRRTDVDLLFLTPWAVLFERADLSPRDVVHRYERYAYPMRAEVVEKRAALLEAHRTISQLRPAATESGVSNIDDIDAGEAELRHRLLISRDHAIGAEAQAAQWRERFEQAAAGERQARDETAAARQEVERLEQHIQQIHASRTWRAGRAVLAPLVKLRSLLSGRP